MNDLPFPHHIEYFDNTAHVLAGFYFNVRHSIWRIITLLMILVATF